MSELSHTENPLGPRELDESTPSAARAYDYYLGGSHNFAHDRELAEQARTVLPCVDELARLNRAFLRRAVRFCLDAGIRQFLDIGSGIPTVGNVHEVAQDRDPASRVVYVDYEPIAYNHASLLLADNPNATIIHEDLRRSDRILDHPDTLRLLDFSQPIGLLMVGVLLFISDGDDPAKLVATYRDQCAPGSYLAMSHICTDAADPQLRDQVNRLVEVYRSADEQVYLRDRAQFSSWFAGLELVDPGVVLLPDWRPDTNDPVDPAARLLGYGGVGLRP